MVNHDLFSKFQNRFIDKQLEITYDGGTITNSELFAESMQLTESLCSDNQLKFGSCEASVIKFKIANVFLPMFGKQITVTMYLDGNRDKPFQIGVYKVASDTPTADRKWRDIVAYDAMYDILHADVSYWYNKVLPNKDSTLTLKEFRTSFIKYFGLDQQDTTLINDKMIVEKTIEPSELSGKTVITCICEINGCFGHIGRDGKFQWIYLTQGIEGLYPANDLYPANNLYPRDPKGERIGQNGSYTNCKYSDFVTKTITKLQIRASENDIGAISGDDTDNCYIIQDNFLVYGKNKDDFQTIADNVLPKIKGITYRPFQATVQGNPCYEVGDAVRLFTKYELIESYILSRTLKGIQALRDSFTTKGEERYGEKVNSVRNSIIQLKGKTNELERNVEETKSTITDVEKGLQSQITQNASSITAEVKRATDAETQLSSKIAINADSITAEVKRAQGKEEQLSSSIKINADNITSEVTRATTAEGNLSSRITQTADSITAEVTRATTAEGNLASSIKVNADNILLKVSKGDVSSEISQEAGKISIKSNRISIESTNFTLTEDGSIVATNATLSGSLKTTKDANRYLQIAGGDIKYYSGGEYKAGIIIDDEGYINLDGNIKIRGYYPAFCGYGRLLSFSNSGLTNLTYVSDVNTSNLTVVTGINFNKGSLTYENKLDSTLGWYSYISNYTAPSCTANTTTLTYVSSASKQTQNNLVYSLTLGHILVQNGIVSSIYDAV